MSHHLFYVQSHFAGAQNVCAVWKPHRDRLLSKWPSQESSTGSKAPKTSHASHAAKSCISPHPKTSSIAREESSYVSIAAINPSE